jgi:uncharacterized integral membrane protein
MWFLKNSAWLLILFVGGWFFVENRNETVSAIHLGGRNYPGAPVAMVVFVTFLLGMFCAFVLTLFQHLRIRSAMSRVQRENQDMKRELSQLRNLPLEDLNLPELSGTVHG